MLEQAVALDPADAEVLVAGFVASRVLAALAEDFGREDIAGLLRLPWLGIVAYTWVAPAIFARMLAKEIRGPQLRDDYCSTVDPGSLARAWLPPDGARAVPQQKIERIGCALGVS